MIHQMWQFLIMLLSVSLVLLTQFFHFADSLDDSWKDSILLFTKARVFIDEMNKFAIRCC